MCVSVSAGRSISVEFFFFFLNHNLSVSLLLRCKHTEQPLRIVAKAAAKALAAIFIYESRSKPPSPHSSAANNQLRGWGTSRALELGAGAREPPSSGKLCRGVGARERRREPGRAGTRRPPPPPPGASSRGLTSPRRGAGAPRAASGRCRAARGGAEGWGLRWVYKAGAGLTSDLGLFIWGARGRRRLAAAVAAAVAAADGG